MATHLGTHCCCSAIIDHRSSLLNQQPQFSGTQASGPQEFWLIHWGLRPLIWFPPSLPPQTWSCKLGLFLSFGHVPLFPYETASKDSRLVPPKELGRNIKEILNTDCIQCEKKKRSGQRRRKEERNKGRMKHKRQAGQTTAETRAQQNKTAVAVKSRLLSSVSFQIQSLPSCSIYASQLKLIGYILFASNYIGISCFQPLVCISIFNRSRPIFQPVCHDLNFSLKDINTRNSLQVVEGVEVQVLLVIVYSLDTLG